MTGGLSVTDLTVRYGGTLALDAATFSIPGGVLAGLIGPNGAGKSTALKAILGLTPPDGGRVLVFGRERREGLADVVYVPQRSGVDQDFPVLVRDVVMQGLWRELGLFGRPKPEQRERVQRAIAQMELIELQDRQIGELSGGQQQRAFLARALAQRGRVYLLDEPFAGVDAATERTILHALRALRDAGAAVLVVHHELGTVREWFDHAVLLNRRVVAAGPVESVFTESNLDRAYGGRLARLAGGAALVPA